MLGMNSESPEHSITAQDTAQVHLVFPEVKKNSATFEVTIQPEPKKIMEVVRLQDGSQSFRVRWKDMWLHEQYITAYPDLLNDFWEKQKDELVGDTNSVGDVHFATMNVTGPESSVAGDSYPIHPFLLQVDGAKEAGIDAHDVFDDPKTLLNPISVTGNHDNDESNPSSEKDSDNLINNSSIGVDSVMAGIVDDNQNDLNFSEEVSSNHVLHNDLTSNEKGPVIDQHLTEGNVMDEDRYSLTHSAEGSAVISPENGEHATTAIHSAESGICVEGVTYESICNNIENDTVKESALIQDNTTQQKRKASSALKRPSKRGKKKGIAKDDKKASKSKSPEEEEKENVDCEDEYNAEGTEMVKAASDENQKKDLSEGSEKFSYPESKGPCVCDICGKVISNKYGLREHQTVVHFKNGKFECQICGKRVTNKRALNLHMTSHSNERQYVCELCGSSHKTKGNLNYHVKTMHTMIKNFRCDICFKTFKVQAELKEHCFTVHANEGVITCIVCKKKLTTALSIYTHSVMHSGAREHECDICGYAFKTLTGLKEHKITHSDEKPIRQCPYCERKFFSRSQYNAHVMRHTADGSLITYKCPECDVKFQHKSSFNRHVIRHQPGGDLHMRKNPYLNVDEADLPEGVCHKCRKHYSSKSGLYLHLKKCRDGIVQQFQCPYCERGCSNRCSLKRHIQRRHKTIDLEQQRIQGEVMMAKQDLEGVDNSQGVLPHDDMQYGTYFDHGYGNVTVDASQLSTVDLQLLLDTSGAANNDNQDATHLISNMGQVTQLTHDNSDTAQNITDKILQLNILTETEAAQFAAQLTQHGVIVRSADMNHEPDQEQHLIVGATNIDGQTSQLLVSESQAAQLLANAQLDNNNALTLETEPSDLLQEAGVLQFDNNRTAVIQIQHNDVITTQQVLTLSDQQIQNEIHASSGLEETLQEMNNENVQVTITKLPRSSAKLDCDDEVQQYIEEEQIVSNLSENNSEHGYQNLQL